MSSIKQLLLSALLWMPLLVYSQKQFPVTGTVYREGDNQPITNATINVEGLVLKTNDLGAFSFVLHHKDTVTLEILHIGFHSEKLSLLPTGEDVLTITLKPKYNALEEIVVSTGYEQLPLERATGSFEKVDNTLFNRQISTDVISRLDGLVPGMLFDKRDGSNNTFNVRGTTGLAMSDQRPLIILDNFPYEGDIDNINPNDIQDVVLLKDAAAASIWGAKAGNGVLVITTKSGSYDQPNSITLNTNVTFSERPDIFYRPQMSSSDYIDVEQFLFERGVYDNLLSNTTDRPVITPAVEIFDQMRSGIVSGEVGSQLLNELRSRDVRDDLSTHFYRPAISQQHALNIRGGSKKHNYFLSMGYDRNRGNLVGNSDNRFTLRAQNDVQLTEKLQMQSTIIYTDRSAIGNSPMDIHTGEGTLYPYARLVEPDGSAAILERNYRLAYLNGLAQPELLDWRYRPLNEPSLVDRRNKMQDILATANISYQLTPSWKLQANYQFQQANTADLDMYDEASFFARNLINRFTQLNDGGINRIMPVGSIRDQAGNSLRSHAGRLQLNYDKTWQHKHHLSGLAGSEIRDARREMFAATRIYGFNKETLVGIPIDPTSRYPVFDNLGPDAFIPGFGPQNNAFVDRFVSLFANAAYTYNEKYTLSASARRDASNLLGVETNNRWKPLWSTGIAWTLSKEDFFSNELIRTLKVRATYGYSGNVNNSITALSIINYQDLGPTHRLPQAYVINPPNPGLRWENVATTNIGLDFEMVNGRIGGSLEYYSKRSKDLIGSIPVDPTSGFNTMAMNSAELLNRGFDASIQTVNLEGSFRWISNFLFSYNRNTVLSYLATPATISSYTGTGAAVNPIVGQPAYAVVSYRFMGLDPETGDPLGILGDQVTDNYLQLAQLSTANDLIFHGSALPEVYGALRNDFTYGAFSLSLNLTYRTGYYFRRPTIMYADLLRNNTNAGHGDFDLRWQEPGDEHRTTVPSMIFPADTRRDQFYHRSDVNVEKGNHLRLQDLNISYELRRNKHPLLPVENIKFTAYARNLGIIWSANKSDIDPDFAELPPTKSLALGLTVTF